MHESCGRQMKIEADGVLLMIEWAGECRNEKNVVERRMDPVWVNDVSEKRERGEKKKKGVPFIAQ